MALIDEINKKRYNDQIIDIRDEKVIDKLYDFTTKEIGDDIRGIVNNNRGQKLYGIIFINENAKKITYGELMKEPCYINNTTKIINVFLTHNPMKTVPELRCEICKNDGEHIYGYGDYYGPIYNSGNGISLFPFIHYKLIYGERREYCVNDSISSSTFCIFDYTIKRLFDRLKDWFQSEGLKCNIEVKDFDEVIPIKKIPYYKERTFGKPKLIGEKQILSDHSLNKCIVFECTW